MVLGAAGFIGRWVARKLFESGARLFLVVRDAERARSIFTNYDVQGDVVEFDLSRLEDLRDLIAGLKPSITFNLAGYGIDRFERDEKEAFLINAELPQKLCEAIAECRDPEWMGQNIIHTGSALEYGEISGDLSEDSQPAPTTLYGKSKLAGSKSVERFCREHELRGVIARLFTIYGPGEHEGRLTPSLMKAARTRESLELTAGRQSRDFTYVADVADGLLRLGLSSAQNGGIVNLATGRLTTVRQFIEQAAGVLNIPGERLLFGAAPTRQEEMSHAPVAIEKLKSLTGWIPQTGVPDGILKTWAFDAP